MTKCHSAWLSMVCMAAGASAAEPGEGACAGGSAHKGASAAGEQSRHDIHVSERVSQGVHTGPFSQVLMPGVSASLSDISLTRLCCNADGLRCCGVGSAADSFPWDARQAHEHVLHHIHIRQHWPPQGHHATACQRRQLSFWPRQVQLTLCTCKAGSHFASDKKFTMHHVAGAWSWAQTTSLC